MPPAARKSDIHVCTAIDPGPSPHVGGPITVPCAPDVLTNTLPQVRGTDQATCTGGAAPNFIVTGSGTVLVNNLPAARQTDKTMHPGVPSNALRTTPAPGPGVIAIGSPNVLIGGPTVGVTLGNPSAGQAACRKAMLTRKSLKTYQSYENCGIESARQIINQRPSRNKDEDTLLDESMRYRDAEQKRRRADSGGSNPHSRRRILTRNGVPSSLQDPTMQNIVQAVAEKRGVITSHDLAILRGTANTGGHAILVTGIEFDANGKPVTIITNDTGPRKTKNCSRRYAADLFENSLRPGRDINVTYKRIW